jgi:serine/threonine protein kinase
MSPVADCDLLVFLKVTSLPAERRIDLRHFYGCLASALSYLQENKICHKDIKPSNILVHGSNVLITDFGTSRDWSYYGE